MKKIIFILAFAIVGFCETHAQENNKLGGSSMKLGMKAGYNAATINGDHTQFFGNKPGFHLGFFLEFPVNHNFSFQPEILFSQQGARQKVRSIYGQNTLASEARLNYLNVPMMFKYYFDDQLHFDLGPQLGLFLNGEEEIAFSDGSSTTRETLNASNYINKFDFGVALGAGFKFPNGFIVDVRYVLGISNILKENPTHNSDTLEYIEMDMYRNNRVIQFSVGYLFN